MLRSIIFLCTANAIRSQMAEAIVRSFSQELLAYSGGIQPCGYLDKHVIAVMKEINIDLSNQFSKSIDFYKDKKIDIVITLSSTAYQECPEWLYKNAVCGHWGFKDVSGESRRDYRRLRDELLIHIKHFLNKYSASLNDEELRNLLQQHSR